MRLDPALWRSARSGALGECLIRRFGGVPRGSKADVLNAPHGGAKGLKAKAATP